MVKPFRQITEKSRLRVVPPEEQPAPRRPSDEALIDAFERGEGQACEPLYDRLIGPVEATLYRVLGCRDDAHDDLVQTAFEQIVLTLSKRRFARACSLSSWAVSVTTHVAFNTMRSRTRERRVVDRRKDAEDEARVRATNVDLERHVGARETLGLVRRHLSDMDENRAETLLLHDVMGHELAEIAVLTGVSVAAAQSRLVRGRKELKRKLMSEGLMQKPEERR